MDILSFVLGYNKGKKQSGGNVDAINDRLDTILGEVVGENKYTVTFIGADGSTLCSIIVVEGDNCADPVSSGIISKPTKASTELYTYSYSGWSSSANGTASSSLLKNITEDKTLYAVFKESERKYTVRFYDGSTLLKTEYFTYGGSSTYTYKKDNYVFTGWSPEPTNITSDMDCYAQLEESYTFVDASWEYIADISARGLASQAFAVGDTKDVEITVAGTTYTLPVQIVGFDHDDLADGSGKAGISIITVPIISTYKMMWDITGSANNNLEGVTSVMAYNWSRSAIRTALNDTIFACLQAKLRSVIKPVLKESQSMVPVDGTYAVEIITTSDKLWIPSATELGGIDLSDGTPYEYFETSAKTRRQRTLWEGIPDDYPAYSAQTYGTRSFPVGGGGTGYSFNAQTGESITSGSGTRRHLVGFCV